jgi:1-pyrroline-5-carboxylate dehydrogenase
VLRRPPTAARHAEALARARAESAVVVGGNTDDSTGWFVDPTILEVADPTSPFSTQELFAPVLTTYVYDDADWEQTLRLVDESTPYGLTGAVFAEDAAAVPQAGDALRYTAGTSTSTTSRPARSSGSSRSAGPARRARTTRPAPSGT